MAPQITPAGSGSYRVTWTVNGKRRQRTLHSVRDARRFHRAQHDAFVAGAEAPTPDLSEVARSWANQPHLGAGTARRVQSTLTRLIEPFFGARPVDQIRPQDVSGWVHWLRREHDYMDSTVRSHFCVLRSALDWAVVLELIKVNPCSQVRLPRVPARQRAEALTRMPAYQPRRPSAVHHRAGGALVELRRALAGSDGAEELTALLRHLDFGDDD